ncbi:MAG TPA: hypothetical protein VF615_10195 [Longimicrobiaceae bacterium]|jgi:hypothetical protein
MRPFLVLTLSIAAAAAAAAPRAAAQAGDPYVPPRAEPRPSFEYFVARSRLEQGGVSSRLDGVGGRVLWPLPAGGPLLSRMSVGGYLTHAEEDGREPDLWHYGVQADMRLARAPLAGRVDPLLSLGVGAVRVEEPVAAAPPPAPRFDPGASLLTPLRDGPARSPALRTRTSPSLVPGVGARVHLLPWLGFRGDVRMLVDFRDGARRDLEVAGGLSITA